MQTMSLSLPLSNRKAVTLKENNRITCRSCDVEIYWELIEDYKQAKQTNRNVCPFCLSDIKVSSQ